MSYTRYRKAAGKGVFNKIVTPQWIKDKYTGDDNVQCEINEEN